MSMTCILQHAVVCCVTTLNKFELPSCQEFMKRSIYNLNKGGGHRVPSHAKMRICRWPISMDLAGVSCSWRFRGRTPLSASCLEIARSDEIRSGAPVLLYDCLVLEGVLWSSTGCYHHARWFLVPWWSQLAENAMDAEFWGLAMMIRVFVTMRNLLRDSRLIATAWIVEATVHEKFTVLPCRLKIKGLGLIGCAWQWFYWIHYFMSVDSRLKT
jgi:hypothetical protein